MTILRGKEPCERMRADLKKRVEDLGRSPKLVIFSIDASFASERYISKKCEFGERIGCDVYHRPLSSDLREEELEEAIEEASLNTHIDGIVVQLPVPVENAFRLLDCVSLRKDVDGLSARNVAALMRGEKCTIPAVTRGVCELMDHYDIPCKGKEVCIIGESFLVGRPTALTLLRRGATVTVCHERTTDLKKHTRNADIVISATGVIGLITSDMITHRQTLIDIGTSISSRTGRVCGDVNADALEKAKHASPVPGGAGPLTVASLFCNLLELVEDETV